MGPAPHFTAIRLFTNTEGWVAQFTDEGIARHFPMLDDLPGPAQ
jgi:1,2-dihydroxy-3-keto-5-methylthiopentene dioxygenase